jgi:hypothetical protein
VRVRISQFNVACIISGTVALKAYQLVVSSFISLIKPFSISIFSIGVFAITVTLYEFP